jgi:hypothetical protein
MNLRWLCLDILLPGTPQGQSTNATLSEDYYHDPLKNKNNSVRQRDCGNKVGQRVKNTIAIVDLMASYPLRHNLLIETKQIPRPDGHLQHKSFSAYRSFAPEYHQT